MMEKKTDKNGPAWKPKYVILLISFGANMIVTCESFQPSRERFSNNVLEPSEFIFRNKRQNMGVCDLGYPVIDRDFNNPGVFDSLTPQEYKAVRDFMLDQTELNLVPINKATLNCAYIYLIDLYLPSKTEVLAHLDQGFNQPRREAKVIVIRGDLPERQIEEYAVGPLPKGPRKYKKINSQKIPYNFKPMDQVEENLIENILKDATRILYPVLMESYGLYHHNCSGDSNCLTFTYFVSLGTNDHSRETWYMALRDIEGYYLFPLGLEILVDHTQSEYSNWKIKQIVYNGQSRPTAESLLQDYFNGNIDKLKINTPSKKLKQSATYERRGVSEMDPPKQGPKLVEPDGHRYSVNGTQVSYMHWKFNINNKASTGVQLFDIRFQNKRIAYELSFQEASVFYAGYSPVQVLASYYDVSWLMGSSINELVSGVDCPETSTYLDVYYFADAENARQIKRGICIFETYGDIPLRRHYAADYGGTYSFYGGLADYRLVVRSIANVWNYDYIFDYIFHLNGAIEVKVSATGYVQAGFPLKEEKKYGAQMNRYMTANMHQHLFHFKIDLDVNGVDNTYSTLDISTETIKLDWYDEVFKTQLKYDINPKTTESEANYKDKSPTRYDLFYNDAVNANHNKKAAYRVLNLGASPFLLSNSTVTNGARWAKFPIAVSKYKDSERSSTSIYAQNGAYEPIVDFESFVSDNDNILNQDIVAWVSMGVLHVPHTEDIPSTTTPSNQGIFFLLPYNYFPECPSMSSPNAVYIKPSGETGVNVDTFGTSYKSDCLQQENGPDTFDGRVADV